MNEPVCKRCGQCCMRKLRNNPKRALACPYLIIHDNKLTSCKAWERRKKLLQQGKHVNIGLNRKCGSRIESKIDFENCPYNTNKPIIKMEVKIR